MKTGIARYFSAIKSSSNDEEAPPNKRAVKGSNDDTINGKKSTTAAASSTPAGAFKNTFKQPKPSSSAISKLGISTPDSAFTSASTSASTSSSTSAVFADEAAQTISEIDSSSSIAPSRTSAAATTSKTKNDTLGLVGSCEEPSVSVSLEDTTTQIHPQELWGSVECMDPAWRVRLSAEFNRPYFKRLREFVDQEYSSKTVFPPKELIFSSLSLCSFDDVKVVIVGQDPYHGPGQAHGLAFSVRRGVQIPPSLRNMFTEAQRDVGIPAPAHGCLECWARQGVLLLNTVLTVRKGEANSHKQRGWEEFTDAVIREVSKKPGMVYLLWGKPALTKCKNISANKSNVIITSSHPSPLSAYSTKESFMQSKCFSRCNEALTKMGKEPIDWSVR